MAELDWNGYRITKSYNTDTGTNTMRVFRTTAMVVENGLQRDWMGDLVAEWECC